MQFISDNEQQTIDFAISFASTLAPHSMVLLKGELGAGKTCFVRGLCEGLGGDPRQVNSPTFTIVQEYDVSNQKQLIHIDAYRLSGEDDLESIGWDELCEDPMTIIAIEWPTRIKAALPNDAIEITIEHVSEHERSITVSTTRTS